MHAANTHSGLKQARSKEHSSYNLGEQKLEMISPGLKNMTSVEQKCGTIANVL